MLILRLLIALGIVAIGGVLTTVLAARAARGAPIMVRLTFSLSLLNWFAVWVFQILASLMWFRLSVVMPLLVAVFGVGAIRYSSQIRQEMRKAQAELALELGELGRGLRRQPLAALGVLALSLLLSLRFVRALVTPSLGWDDFTYHLYRAGLWVQNGGFALQPGRDAWGYYEFFPWGGDAVWAWALVWGATDVLVPAAAIATWIAVVTAAYALARRLGQQPTTALVVALALATLPSQISLLSTAYVDNNLLFLGLVTSLCVLELESRLSRPDRDSESDTTELWLCFMIGASCGLATGVKMSFLPVLALAAVGILWRRWRPLASILRRSAAFALGAFVLVPNLLFNLYHRGSPFYPFRVLAAVPHNENLAATLADQDAGAHGGAILGALKALVSNPQVKTPFVNLGWLGLVLVVLGCLGLVIHIRDRRRGVYAVWTVLLVGAVLVPTLLPANSKLLTEWGLVLGRLWVPGLAALLPLSGLVGGRLINWLVLPIMVIEFIAYAPHKWPQPLLGASLDLLAVAAVSGVVLALAFRDSKRVLVRLALTVLCIAVTLLFAVQLREPLRYETYRLTAERELDDVFPARSFRAWRVWRNLDRLSDMRIAAAAGYGRDGHTWFRYPLLGSRLQNEVVYQPIGIDGEIVDRTDTRRKESRTALDRDAWLRGLLEQEVDYVAALWPRTFEHRWIQQMPEVFDVEFGQGNSQIILARVRRPELEEYLSAHS